MKSIILCGESFHSWHGSIHTKILFARVSRPVYTMEHEVGPWMMAFSHGPTSMVWFLIIIIIIITESLGPSLGINWMWTKRNDHAPRTECVDFFWYMPKKGIFEFFFLKFDHSLVFSCLHFLFPKNIHYNFIVTIFLCYGPLFFTSFASPIIKPVGPCQWIM